jgi:hypothetical protein
MKFTKEFLLEVISDDAENAEVVDRKIADKTRWTIIYELVFSYQDKYFLIKYERGSNAYQDIHPFAYFNDKDEIECTEVKPVKVIVTKYVPITTII